MVYRGYLSIEMGSGMFVRNRLVLCDDEHSEDVLGFTDRLSFDQFQTMTDVEDDSVGVSVSPYSDLSTDSSVRNLTCSRGDPKWVIQKKTKNTPGLKVTSGVQGTAAIKVCLIRKLNSEALVVRISPDRSVFAVGMTNGDIQLFRLSEDTPEGFVMRMKINTETLPCTDIRFPAAEFRNKYILLASYASGFIRLWHYTASYLKSSLICQWEEKAQENTSIRTGIGNCAKNENNQVLCLAISCDGRRFVSGGTDTHIRIYSLGSTSKGRVLQPCIRTDAAAGHTARVTALLYHPRGKQDAFYAHIFLSAGWDDCIHIWDDQKAVSLWQYYGPHVAGSDGMDIDPVKNLVLTCSWRREPSIIQMWKFPEFVVDIGKDVFAVDKDQFKRPSVQFVYEPNMKGSHGYVAQFDPTYQYVVFAGSNENIVCILDTFDNSVIAELKDLDCGVYSASIYLDSNVKKRLRVVFTNGKNISLGGIGTNMPSAPP